MTGAERCGEIAAPRSSMALRPPRAERYTLVSNLWEVRIGVRPLRLRSFEWTRRSTLHGGVCYTGSALAARGAGVEFGRRDFTLALSATEGAPWELPGSTAVTSVAPETMGVSAVVLQPMVHALCLQPISRESDEGPRA